MSSKSPTKEFSLRRKIALKGDGKEMTLRLVGLLEWMEGIPAIALHLEALERAGGEALLNQALFDKEELRGSRHSYNDIHPPKAKSFEQIASVGLALVREANNQGSDISEFAWDFGISTGQKGRESPIEKYIVPFLDFIEQRLPVPVPTRVSSSLTPSPPPIIHDSLKKFRSEHPDSESTCFVMMRFGKTKAHARLEKTLKQALKRHGLIGLLARDREFHEDLYPNIQTYLHGCAFGIAVFERLESDEFNPNVALEVGYMFGLRKQVLLLKDQTLRALHTDLVGKLYREFDPQNPEDTIPAQIDSWLTDKGLA
jgi:hypothetical protein